MRPLLTLAVLLAPLAAGCLEEQGGGPPPGGGAGGPSLEAPGPLLERPDALLSVMLRGSGLANFSVDADADALTLVVDAPPTWRGRVALRDPGGAERAACDSAPCSTTVQAPAVGEWVVAYDAGEVGARVEVRAAERARPEEPREASLDVLYEGGYDGGAAASRDGEDHVFHVPAGYDRLVLRARLAEGARVALVDPHGEARAECPPDASTCEQGAASPAPGLWRARFSGAGRAEVNVAGEASHDVAPPSNYTAVEVVHEFSPEPGTNVTLAFFVQPGYEHMRWSTGFVREGLAREGDIPRVVLRSPDGAVAARCEPGPQDECPPQLRAFAGLWRVALLGPATGEVEVEAFVFGPAAHAPTPTTPTSSGSLPTPPRTERVSYDYVFRDVPPSRIDHVPFLSNAGQLAGRVGQGVRLRDPGGALVEACDQPTCEWNVSTGWAGVWTIAYEGKAASWADLTYDEGVVGSAPAGGDGRFYTALDATLTTGSPARAVFVPPHWRFLDAEVSFEGVMADDEATRLDVREPAGGAATCFAFKTPCRMRLEARPGLYALEVHGSAGARAQVRIVVS